MRRLFWLAGTALSVAASGAMAEEGRVFTLGQVTVSTDQQAAAGGAASTLTDEEMRLFRRDKLDQALELVPGAAVSEVGNRNESNIWIRGFDRWRVPLYQDGIPIYLPADNRVDFGRFATTDLAEIQVSKGFASVIDGPGAMGGAINLVSRQVARQLEADLRLGSAFDADGAFNGFQSDAFAGTRQSNWYFQMAGSEDYQNHLRLSEDFQPGTLENGGNRNRSYHQDYKINVKAGFVPNQTDEYSLNVIDQMGHKNNPPPDTSLPAGTKVNYWDWPAWDKQSVYWLSKTALDDLGSYVKLRAYYDRFYNVLNAFDSQTYATQASKAAFVSKYDDRAAGGSAEVSKELWGGQDRLRAAFHYRWDRHNAWEATNAAANGPWYAQPWVADEQNTFSAAFENIFHPAADWDLTTGFSYDYRNLISAQDWVASGTKAPYGYILDYPTSDKRAINPEAALTYHFSATGNVYASLADRTRFPTLFEMFSNRFGTYTGNPVLQPERSIYWETGASDTVAGTRLKASLYWARVMDAIVSVPVNYGGSIGVQNQNRNAGTELHRGFELEAGRQLFASLEVGANYAYLDRENLSHNAVPTDTPKHKLFLFADWQPVTGLEIVPSVELSSKRWYAVYGSTSLAYRGGDRALANLKVAYQLTQAVSFDIGANNLFDENYQVADGYHGQGRSYFTDLRVSF